MSQLQAALDDRLRVTSAVDRLINIALRDTGQSRRCANFLLAWWNAADNGGFDLTDLWNVDSEIATDMVTVFTWVSTHRYYVDHISRDYSSRMEEIWKRWNKVVGA
jgi:hypothetical protein